ncbi:hypothetical protein PMAYCL1PPCAC_08600, partial [Pristionchus mayeri]
LFWFINGLPVGEEVFSDNPFIVCTYQLDCVASICIGAAFIAFPQWLLHRQVSVSLDASHELAARLMGAYFVATFQISQHALHWDSVEDRRVGIQSRIISTASILAAQLWSQKEYNKDWSGDHWVGISLFSIWTISAIGYSFVAPTDTPEAKKSN